MLLREATLREATPSVAKAPLRALPGPERYSVRREQLNAIDALRPWLGREGHPQLVSRLGAGAILGGDSFEAMESQA